MACGGGAASPAKKKSFFTKWNVWVHFDAVFNRQKTRTVTRSLGTRMLRFNRQTKLTKTVQTIDAQTRVSDRTIARPWIRHSMPIFFCHSYVVVGSTSSYQVFYYTFGEQFVSVAMCPREGTAVRLAGPPWSLVGRSEGVPRPWGTVRRWRRRCLPRRRRWGRLWRRWAGLSPCQTYSPPVLMTSTTTAH